ncbi:SDR family NAD(P)-dependent oxidoreductase [Kumtagia ephedrae]|uniref:Short-chain dehydrogenase n=1 Tax=Kumtagia ephedrae TaxID=2116701 RepID=A0A2P7S4N3_9HYPH|nr:SDR family NAD(P)-dependent oxidoreductase [Mesorhizobium ephedrae]PSJ57448.1 hypothetical protein C7I84_17535 [Mesorhizobium ephedrae]
MVNERAVSDANFVFFGGTAGMGRAAAMELARRGANVLVVARDEKAGVDTVAALTKAGAASARFVEADLSTAAGIAAAARDVLEWRSVLHGVTHSAMSAFQGKQITPDGLEFTFALQYFARAAVNRLLRDALEASGDGRIAHVSGSVLEVMIPDLNDLQYEKRNWGFFRAVLGTQALGFLHVQEAARRWRGGAVSIAACCARPTKTKAMLDKRMPFIMRVMGRFGTTPEKSARNIVAFLTHASVSDANGAALRNPSRWRPRPIGWNCEKAAKLWEITTQIAAERGVKLP